MTTTACPARKAPGVRTRALAPSLVVATLLAVPAPGRDAGRLEGIVTGVGDEPLGGVAVVVDEPAVTAVTDARGRYRIGALAPGSYGVTFTLGQTTAVVDGVEIRDGEITELNPVFDWAPSFAASITVYSASRRRERLVEAPAGVTVIGELEIRRKASTGQVPKLFEFTPGVDLAQTGLYGFNLNARGFNTSLNRRVPTLIDGRDPSVPFLMSPDWPSLSAMEDLASAELVRGPTSALYGANAFNGIVDLVTREPRLSQGGTVRLTAGELSTVKGDLRLAGALGGGFYGKATASYSESEDFSRSRCQAGVPPCPEDSPPLEYPGLTFERLPLQQSRNVLGMASLRLDRPLFGDAHLLTFEGGFATVEGPVVATGNGQVQGLRTERPWARVSYDAPQFNVLAYYNGRYAPEEILLLTGSSLVLDSELWAIEARASTPFAGARGRLAGGVSHREEAISTRNTVTFDDVSGERSAVFAQVDYTFSPALRVVVAGRWDESSLHRDQLSPKAGVVYSLTPEQTVRLTYNEAFQSPNYNELHLYAPTAISTAAGPLTSLDLGALEAALCTPRGVSCGFATPVAIRVVGNESLSVEEVRAWELGYSAILGRRSFLTVDVYEAELEDFVTDLLANPFGTVNPNFGPYRPPPDHPEPDALQAALEGALGPLFAFLSNDPAGAPILALASYTNAGRADTRGVDLGVHVQLNGRVAVEAAYSWFDFELDAAALDEEVESNTPEHKVSLGVSYRSDRWNASLSYRWVEAFRWSAGLYTGPVPEYDTVDLDADVDVSERWSLGLHVSNLFDHEHYETFGGAVLGRRALWNVAYRW